MFNIVLVPALLAILAIVLGVLRGRRARGHAHEGPDALIALVVLGVLAIAGGWYFGTARRPGSSSTVTAAADVPGPRSEAAGCRAHRDHPSGQDDCASRSMAMLGPGRSRRLPGAASKLRGMLTALTELRVWSSRAPPIPAVHPARPGRPERQDRQRRTCCACSTHPASRSPR